MFKFIFAFANFYKRKKFRASLAMINIYLILHFSAKKNLINMHNWLNVKKNF